MRRSILVYFLVAFCLPAIGQIRVIDKDGKTYEAFGGIGNIAEELLLYRDIYGQYPNDKKILLDFILDENKYDSTDSLLFPEQISMKNKALTKLINCRRNRLTVSNDTCSFYIAKTKTIIQCIGGVAELQKSDSYMFRVWTISRLFDKNGHYIHSLSSSSPFMPHDFNRQFRYVVTMERRSTHEQTVFQKRSVPPVLIPITVTRNGEFNYDASCLNGIQLFYQEYGKPLDPNNTLGPISIEEAINPDYLEAMKFYLNCYMERHEEVESMKLWELLLFNNKPN
jgi:hypothetical protein